MASVNPSGLGKMHVYEVDGHLILHSGRPVPSVGEKVERNEGVGIVLNPFMVRCWKSGGETWHPISSRIVSARLKINEGGEAARNHPMYIHIVSVYAPTHKATQEAKDKFYDDLQRVIDGVSASDLLY